MKRAVLCTTILLLAAACTPPEPATPKPVNIAPPPPSPSGTSTAAAAPDTSIASVAVARAPAGLVIDGDLREWGALPAPPASLGRPEANDDPEVPRDAPKEPPPPNPHDAASRVVFALTGEGGLIAAELGEAAAKSGIWVAVGSHVPDLPLFGEFFGRMGFVVLSCENKPITIDDPDDPDHPGYSFAPRLPEEQAACNALQARRADVKAKHESRFAKLFKIDREGVRIAGPDGALAAIAGAKAAWKAGPHGASVEVSVPLSALPRMGEAPLAMVRLAARVTPAPPALAVNQWVWLQLPDPVSFEPYAALRAHALARALDLDGSPGGGPYNQPMAVSYQPGDALHLEVVDSTGCDAAVPREELLYEKVGSLDDIEVGRVAAPRSASCLLDPEDWLAIFQKGKLLQIVQVKGRPRGTLVRDGELYVLGYHADRYGWRPGVWSAFAISSAGAPREVSVEPVADAKRSELEWKELSDFASKDLDSFGWRGTLRGQIIEATWHWDAAHKAYKGKQHTTPAPKKTPAKKK